MKRSEIINELKQNRVPYYLWTDEERAVADGIKREWWLLVEEGMKPTDVDAGNSTLLGAEHNVGCVYRLKPEYQDEPESLWEELRVDSRSMYWGFWKENHEGVEVYHRTDAAPGIQGFGGIMYEDCACKRLDACGLAGKFTGVIPGFCEKHGPHKPLKVRFWRGK